MLCPYCQQDHGLPEKGHRGFEDYYIGLMHIRLTGDPLVYTGYDWLKPEDTPDCPTEHKFVVSLDDSSVDIKPGDFYWASWHGYSGGWFPITEVKKGNQNRVYAIKQEPSSVTKEEQDKLHAELDVLFNTPPS